MKFSLATITAFALALTKTANAAVVYVQNTVIQTETDAPVDVYATVEASAVVQTVNEDVWDTQIIYQAKTVNVTSQRTTVITSISTVEPEKVSPGNIKTDSTNPPITIGTSSLSTPKAVYPVEPSSSSASVDATTTSSSTVATTISQQTSSAVPGSTSLQFSATTAETSTGFSEPSSITSASEESTSESTLESTSSTSESTFASTSTLESTSTPEITSTTPTSTSESTSTSENTPTSTSAAISSAVAGGYSPNQDIFEPIDTNAPPSVFPSQGLSSVPLPSGVDGSGTIQTNKFFSNMIIGDQSQPVYCLPYKLAYTNDADFQGIAISYTDASQRVFGPIEANTNAAKYYLSPVGLNSFIVGAQELTSSGMGLKVSNMDTFSADATVVEGSGSINFPMLQGMGFVTAEYSGMTPVIRSPLGIKTLSKATNQISDTVREYTVILGNDASWSIYVTLPSSSSSFDFSVDGSTNSIIGSNNDNVVIQIAYIPGNSEAASIYRQAAGMYAVSGSLYGSVVSDNTASHGIKYATKGSSQSGCPLIFALPHHALGFVDEMASKKVGLTLDSTAKGEMTGYLTSSFDFSDTLPREIMFLPWSSASAFGKGLSYSVDALKAIAESANSEIQQDMEAQIMTDSTYFSGKGLDKFAYILLVLHDVLQDQNATAHVLGRVQGIFDKFLKNEQMYPLIYDTTYKGITSSASLKTGDNGADFGSPAYSDHHFHYGYFVHAAAVVGYVDEALGGTWAKDNAGWVNSLIRDVANPSKSDGYFPVSRYFDWYSGHSWAKGLFASADGKDEESTSEDYNFAYGMKLWGRVIGDGSMESRGDLMLAVMKRSLCEYFLMSNNNQVQPGEFIGNKIPGITFENKLHHSTYFGDNLEYIQGIHMIPVTPISSYFRGEGFVQEEWNQVLSGIIPSLNSGWLGILRSNQALFDPKTAYNFFSSSSFQSGYLDGGASLTWYLAFSAGVGGSQV